MNTKILFFVLFFFAHLHFKGTGYHFGRQIKKEVRTVLADLYNYVEVDE